MHQQETRLELLARSPTATASVQRTLLNEPLYDGRAQRAGLHVWARSLSRVSGVRHGRNMLCRSGNGF